ncbi:MAG: MAPEG family protein [Pseudomonadota bacterium]
MTAELIVLALAALLQVVQLALMAIPANLELGVGKTLSPRDNLSLEASVSPRTARLYRAFNNHFEALALFTIAVVVVTLSGTSSALTAACAWAYLAARVAYIPAYAFGLSPWRSLIWFVGLAATVLMILIALFTSTSAVPA